MAGPYGAAPDRAVGHRRTGPRTSRARSPISIARAMVDDRKLHKLIRRTDLVGLYAAGRAIDAVGHRRASRRADAAATRRPTATAAASIVGSGGGNFENQYDYFPLMTAANGDLVGVRPRAVQHGQSDVAAAHAAQQRARPHRHQVRPEGHQRLHHEPQRRRPARGDRGDGGAARRRGGSRRRRGPRDADRAADGALLSRRGPARVARRCDRSTPRATAASSAKARARWCSRRKPRPRAAARRCSARCWAAVTRPKARACSRFAPTATDRRARSRQALDDARTAAGGRRHDRRARATARRSRTLRGRGDSRGVRQRDCRRSRDSSGRSAISSPPPASSRARVGARGAQGATSCPASRRCASSIRACDGPCRCRRAAQAPRSKIALDSVPRLRGTNAALLVRVS